MKKGFLFFYDWTPAFEKLSGEDFKKLFLAMVKYQQTGIKTEDFEGDCALIASFVFPQLERRIFKSNAGKKGMASRWSQSNDDC